MKKWSEYIIESHSPQILLVVDVQKEFYEYIPSNFVEELTKYAGQFPEVYQIWDSNKASGPSYHFEPEKGCYEKKYGTSFARELKEIVRRLDRKENPKNGDRFEFQDNDSSVVKVKNNHGWFYVNEDVHRLLEYLHRKRVIVVGGAEGECIMDLFQALKSFGSFPEYNLRFLYSAKTSQNDQI